MKAQKPKTYVVIPAFNEEKHLPEVLSKLKDYINNIIVIDDGSKDNTSRIAKEKGAHAIKHIVNIGKGAALKTGCDLAIQKGADIIVVMDADGQHDPIEIPRLLETLRSADLVIGSRKREKNMPIVMKLGNFLIYWMTRLLYQVDINDTQSGYRAFSADAYKKIIWRSSDYSMESEMIANAVRNKLKIKEVTIKTIYHDAHKGTTVLDGAKIVLNLLKWKIIR